MKKFNIFTISILLLTFLLTANIYTQDKALTVGPSRSGKPNALLTVLGTESLVAGVEYMRFLKLDNSFMPYLSMGAGAGTWLSGPSLWTTSRFYFGKSNWAPFFGISGTLWNGEVKASDSDVKTDLSAIGVYIPVGIQIYANNGFLASFEVAGYMIVTAEWGVKEVEKKPETSIGLGKGTEFDPQPWFGIKLGFGF